MFGIGFFELLLLFVVALLVLGPEKLPQLARTLGLWYGKIRRTVNKMQSEIEEELALAEIRQQMQDEIAKIQANEQKMEEKLARMEENFHKTVVQEPTETNKKTD